MASRFPYSPKKKNEATRSYTYHHEDHAIDEEIEHSYRDNGECCEDTFEFLKPGELNKPSKKLRCGKTAFWFYDGIAFFGFADYKLARVKG